MATRVAVLRGGSSLEYHTSLEVGADVLRHLPSPKYRASDILLTKDGVFHENGFPKPLAKIVRYTDIVFNALSGGDGENGKIQKVLEAHHVPFTGAKSLPAALATRKHFSREVFQHAGLKVPSGMAVPHPLHAEASVAAMLLKTAPHWVIKPASLGSGIGVGIAKNRSEALEALSRAFFFDDKALIEEHIAGREFMAGVIEHFRKEKYYALPVVEKVRRCELCPARIDRKTAASIQDIARKAHEVLGLSQYSSSDIIVAKRGIFLLETDALPPLLPGTGFAKAAEAIGLEFPELLDHIVTLALARKF
ncbi:MAG: hypothetical protein AAB904_02400 [Patescibacteria group bacterium]